MGKLIGILLLARTWAHIEHLKTSSYAQHMTLGSFYNDIIGLADALAEQYQGEYGLLDIPVTGKAMPGDIVSALDSQKKYIQSIRFDAAPKEDTCTQNIIDEIIALYRSTLYKLRYLK